MEAEYLNGVRLEWQQPGQGGLLRQKVLYMAKLRVNHVGGTAVRTSTIIRVVLFFVVIFGLILVFDHLNRHQESLLLDEEVVTSADRFDDRDFYLPLSTTGQVIHHRHFSLSYSEVHEQAEWVAYILMRERLEMPWQERPDRFEEDPQVTTGSATWADYLRSGYDRGHLAPAADLAFSEEAITESFLMSNISPQARDFNAGIWRELEENTRNWAKKYKKLYIVTGPVLTENIKGEIGKNEISIPGYFYKVILDLSEPELKAIAFLLPNSISYEPLYEYAVSIDEVEQLTGIDFFPELMTDELEARLEADVNLDLWSFSKAKYDLRVQKWNKGEFR